MPRKSFISALFYCIRPSACLGVALFAVAGLGKWDDLYVTILTFSSAFIGSCGCFLINDIFDRDKDLKNNKLRPIVTGEISVRAAFIIAVICCLIFLVASALLTLNTLILATLLIAGFWLYSYLNQYSGLLANIFVAVCSAVAFLYGALVYEVTPLIYLAVPFTFFVITGREILLDALDQTGDKAVGKPSIPLIYGEKQTKIIVSLFFAFGSITLLVYLWYFPVLWPWVSVLLLLLWMPFFLKRKQEFKKWALFNVRSSLLLLLALIALLFIRADNQLSTGEDITTEYCLDKLEKLQSKEDGFYPVGIFPTQRYWISQDAEEDNSAFGTANIAYILRTANERQLNERVPASYSIRRFSHLRSTETGMGRHHIIIIKR